MAALLATYVNWMEGDCPTEWLDRVRERLAKIGVAFRIARSVTREELERNASDADIVVLGGGARVITRENLPALRQCFAIVKMAAGVDDVDVPAATERGIVVVNVPQAVTETVSDHAITLMFAIQRRIAEQDRLIRQGTWNRWAARPGRHFRGSTLGLIGFGRIPRAIIRKLAGFELKVLAHDPYVSAETAAQFGVRLVDLDGLLAQCDLVSIHCALTDETRHLIGERELRLMRREAVLVNTARGPVVDEVALHRALRQGWIAGAALDVLEQEPPDPENPLLRLPNVILSPHLSSVSDLYPGSFWEAICQSIEDLVNHRWPESVVNRRTMQPRWELA